jgi:hypothetical protein
MNCAGYVGRAGKLRDNRSNREDWVKCGWRITVLGLIASLCLMPPGPDAKPDLVRQLARSSCVRVVETKSGASGSGTVVGARGGFIYVLTAAHVVAGGDRIEIRLPGKVEPLTEVDVVAAGKMQDLVLLKVATNGVRVEVLPIAATAPSAEAEFDAFSAGYGEAPEPEVRRKRNGSPGNAAIAPTPADPAAPSSILMAGSSASATARRTARATIAISPKSTKCSRKRASTGSGSQRRKMVRNDLQMPRRRY